MNEKNLKIALCLIVKPDDKEAELLDRCLGGIDYSKLTREQKNIKLSKTDGLAKHVDGIFITITGENQRCKEVAEKYGAHISYYPWDYNFANARNFNFSQVPLEYNYIMWTDSDDVWENPQMIREVVQKADEATNDAILLKYKYDFDQFGNCVVEHLKTRIVKNDGCTTWVGQIHEDFQENRQLMHVLNKQIAVVHLTDLKKIETASLRNIEIAEIAVRNNPKDPHNYWNLANTYLMGGRLKESLSIYLDFISISNSDEERFMSWHRIGDIYAKMGEYGRAIESELEALSLRPWYPDAYFSLGEFYYKTGKLKNAQEMVEMGFTKKIPDTESIVWNPLDYSYNPRLLLAKIYLETNKPRDAVAQLKLCLKFRPKDNSIKSAIKNLEPEIKKFDVAEKIFNKARKLKDKEAIQKLLDTVPVEMKYYPPIIALRNTNFVKETTSGKDVVIVCTYTEHEWDPIVAREKGVGGSEEAVIQLAKRWADAGYNVSVYCTTPRQQERFIDGVWWKPMQGWNFRDKQDVTIIWRQPKFLDFDINSEKIYLDVHDVVPPQEFTLDRMLKVTKVMFKSQVQRDYYKNISDDKCLVIPHGLDVNEFASKEIDRNPYRILNTSSPDRGMKTCMKAIELAYNKLPDNLKPRLKFAQYYGFDIWDHDFAGNADMIAWKDQAIAHMHKLQDMGIMDKDSGVRLSQARITDEYLKSGALLYPSNFFEIGFISGMKAMLAGCIPIVTDVFAQGEFCKGIKIHSDATYSNWAKDLKDGKDFGVENVEDVADKIVEYIQNVDKYESMREELKQYASQFTWDKTADAWVELFKN